MTTKPFLRRDKKRLERDIRTLRGLSVIVRRGLIRLENGASTECAAYLDAVVSHLQKAHSLL